MRYDESVLNYVCTGCGAFIYNAEKSYTKCPCCNYDLKELSNEGINEENENEG